MTTTEPSTALTAEFLTSLAQIPAAEWDSIAGTDYPFLRHAFLHGLEKTACTTADTGWQPCHLLLRRDSELVAVMPLYLKSHSYGEYVFDWSWARAYAEHGLDLIMIDYLQLMSGPGRAENRQTEIAEISRGLKVLAREIDTPVLALSQLSRSLEQRADKRPMLSDLRESGSLEQDADMVVLLHREDAYEPESPRAGEADFIIAKHRNGPTKTITVALAPIMFTI